MKYVLVKTDSSVEIVEISTNEFLNKAYELIKCSFIEIATPNFGRSPFRIVLDDNGKFNGQKFNKLATIFYNTPDMLFGNILIGKSGFNEYGEYDFIGLDDQTANELVSSLEFVKSLIDKGVYVHIS